MKIFFLSVDPFKLGQLIAYFLIVETNNKLGISVHLNGFKKTFYLCFRRVVLHLSNKFTAHLKPAFHCISKTYYSFSSFNLNNSVLNLKYYAFIVFFISYNTLAFAAYKSKTSSSEAVTASKSNWKINNNLRLNSNSLFESRSNISYSILTYEITPEYNFGNFEKNQSLYINQSFYKNWNRDYDLNSDRQTSGYSNTLLGWNMNYNKNWNYNLGAIWPTNPDSAVKETMQLGLTSGIAFNIYNNTITKIGFDFSYTKFFHKFKTNNLGDGNTSYKTSSGLKLNYQWNQIIGGIQGHLFNYWNYDNDQKNFFSLDTSVGFLTKKYNLFIGLNNGGSTLKPNGQDSNIGLYDENQSEIYLSLHWDI